MKLFCQNVNSLNKKGKINFQIKKKQKVSADIVSQIFFPLLSCKYIFGRI